MLSVWRAVLILTGLLGYSAIALRQRIGRRSVYLVASLYVWVCGFTLWQFGQMGGTEAPWIHVACLMPVPSVVFLVPLRQRVTMVAVVVLVTLASYYGPNPEHLTGPYVWLSVAVLLSTAVLSTAGGHVMYKLTRDNFEARRELYRLATTDPLTGAYNRRHFFEMANREVQRSRRYGGSVAVLMADVDHFKRLNDTYGHALGDQALAFLADAMRSTLRPPDLLGRVGGEEFAILLPETPSRGANELAERLCQVVREGSFEHEGTTISMTISAGYATVSRSETDIDGALARADSALYAAKDAGRDRVGHPTVRQAPRRVGDD